MGGRQATMAGAMLIWAPNANSYRRLRPLSFAPLAPSWGYNNRTVALRVPPSLEYVVGLLAAGAEAVEVKPLDVERVLRRIDVALA